MAPGGSLGLGTSFPPLSHTDVNTAAESDHPESRPGLGALAAVVSALGKLCSQHTDKKRGGTL